MLESAESVLSERGYEGASVSGICRRAGVAQGTFYMYFSGKEDVYVQLVERLQREVISQIREATSARSQANKKLVHVTDALLLFVSQNVGLFQVFREAEFTRPEIPRRFYAAVCDELNAIMGSGILSGQLRQVRPQVVAYAVLGMIFFLALRYGFWGDGQVPFSVRCLAANLVLAGIAGGKENTELDAATHSVPPVPEVPPTETPARPQGAAATRQALLDAAEQAFGEAGFHHTMVSTITYLAGVGQGTFYLHFPSKVALFNELVREIGRQFRRRQSRAVEAYSDRRVVEAAGLRSFFRWIREHPGAYRILREAEFVDDHVGKWHYQRLAQGYARGLSAAMDRGEIRRCDPEALSYALQGIAHLSGQRWVLWGKPETAEEEILPELNKFLLHGVCGQMSSTGGTGGY